MKVVIRGKVYDAESEPIMLIFSNDKERLSVSREILDMSPKDGERGFVTGPDKTKWALENPEQYLNINKGKTLKL